MHISRSFLSGKGKYLCGFILLLFGCAISLAFSLAGNDDFNTARREILLRDIGHQLLLQSGDSTSRVLPVVKISENEYQIRFEKAFNFRSDYLVNTTQRLLAEDPLASDYVVNVLNGADKGVTYGYAISKKGKNDIVPCKGRVQPTALYSIDFKFKPKTAPGKYILGSLPFLAFIGFIFLRSAKPKGASSIALNNKVLTFGSVAFNPEQRQLTIGKEIIDLTGTETRLLQILASSPNQTITRSRLQKEIWEDEGVIVGRSLDMFISKLRKKLEPDTASNIVVVRGKGYKLEVSA
jgi:DNA-binding winged helix-turn-helix (wHTH) protein